MGALSKMTVEDLKGQLRGKRVLVRADFNVSDPKTGEIKSDTRIQAAVPTLSLLAKEGAVTFVISHNERPKDVIEALKKEGKSEEEAKKIAVERLSLRKVADRLREILKEKQTVCSDDDVGFVGASAGKEVREAAKKLGPGQFLVLENTRFHPGDEKGDENLAKAIAEDTGAEIYVLDGFSVAHRDQASVTKVAKYVKEKKAVAGILVKKEIDYLANALLHSPAKPYYAFMGGAKVADKIKVIENLLPKLDGLVIGGAMLYPFLVAKGLKAGSDPLKRAAADAEADAAVARKAAEKAGGRLILPTAVVAVSDSGEAKEFDAAQGIPDGFRIRDVAPGPLLRLLAESYGRTGEPKTAVWNGPFGLFEQEPFDKVR